MNAKELANLEDHVIQEMAGVFLTELANRGYSVCKGAFELMDDEAVDGLRTFTGNYLDYDNHD